MLLSTTLSMLSLTLPSPHQLGKKTTSFGMISGFPLKRWLGDMTIIIYEVEEDKKENLWDQGNKMAELSAYRDQHFRVIIVFPFPFSFNCWASQWIKALIFVLLALGFTQWSRKDVSNEWYIVRGKSLILHNRGTNSRVIFAGWRLEKDCYGTGQGQEDSLWILLCWVSFAVEMKTF